MPVTPRGWYTVWSGRVRERHLISSSPGGWVPPAASFLKTSPLGEVNTFNILFRTVWKLSGGWNGRGGTNERQALGVWTGTCHAHFQSGRGTDQRLTLPLEPESGLKQSYCSVASSQKYKLKNGAHGHCNSQTCRVVNDTYHRKMSWGKSSKRTCNQGTIAGKGFQEVEWTHH